MTNRAELLGHPRLRALGGILVSAGSTVVMALVVLLAIGLAQGYRPVVITTGSMAPTAPAGSMIVARPTTEVAMGDILVMRRDDRATVTHRVVEIEQNATGDFFAVTRGDANADIDAAPYPIGSEELVGRWVVPSVGHVLLWIGSPLIALAAIVAAVGVLTVAVLRHIWLSPGEKRPTSVGVRSGGQRQVRPLRVGAATAIGVLVGTTGVAWSLYLGVAGVGGNVFSSAACYDARLGSVQRGQLVNTTNGVQTAAISSVDPTAAFLLFSVRSASDQPADSVMMGQLLDATTVEFTRQTDDATPPPITIEWAVVEYTCGVSVQRGVVDGNGADQIDVVITAVDPSTTFVTGSFVPSATSSTFGSADLQIFELAAPDTVRIRAAGVLDPTDRFSWQAITFTAPGDAGVQNVTTTLGPGTGSATIPIPSPVDPDTTLVISSSLSSASGADIGERLVRVQLLDPTTVEVTRLVATESITIAVQVVELRDGSTVQRGIIDLASTDLDGIATLAPVDVSRTVAVSTVTSAGGLSGGASDHVAGGTVGEGSATVTMTDSSTVTVERGTAASNASFPFQAITWGGPAWADPSSAFRQRIDVTAGAVDAPNGYTTPFTLDHRALVDSGLALASGNDLRLWRHDGTSWTELDRVLDDAATWNALDTKIWFRTQESIAAAETVSYWLYFGNPSPPPALDDPANVWLLTESFEDGTLGRFEDRTSGTAWYRALPWTRRKVLTIDAADVPVDLIDHQLLVQLTDADLAVHAQADGSDIRFTAADGSTALAHEIEEFDPATGALTAWVRLPLVSSTGPTVLHLYYGAADAPSQAAPRQVWEGEIAAWHLARDPSGPAPTLDDSGPGANDGLALGDPVALSTPAGPGVDLDGTTDRLESSPLDLGSSSFTVSVFFRADTLSGDAILVSQGDPTAGGVFDLAVDTSSSPVARFRVRTDGITRQAVGGPISAGNWHHLVAVWDGSAASLIVDGTPTATAAAPGALPGGSNLPVVLGGDAAGASTLDGALADVRLAPTAWTDQEAAFVSTNLSSPGIIVSAGPATGGNWFDQGDWATRRPLTVDARFVAGTLADYPLLVQLADPDLGLGTQNDGDDLVFVAADGVTRLDHQIEAWDSGSGSLTAWVRLPLLDATDDTEIFLYLDNPSAVDQSDSEGVWGPDADLVLLGN